MKPVEVSLEQVLLARENRAGRQQRLLAQYGLPLVSFTMNMAGPVKDTPLSRFAFQAGVAALTKHLGGPVSCCLTEAVTGCEALLVYDRPAQALKDVCMELESTEVGRLYDLDVLDAAGEKLSRPEMRRCLVCGGPVAVCSRSRAHGLKAICTETTRRLAEFACTTLGNLAADALREEAALSAVSSAVESIPEESSQGAVDFAVSYCEEPQPITEEEAAATLESLRDTFPEGAYWNHVGVEDWDEFTVTDSPCQHDLYWDTYCNTYTGGIQELFPQFEPMEQCLGFAALLSDLVFGEDAPVSTFTDYTQLRVGDNIRLELTEHSMVVLTVDGEGITVVECNSDYEHCRISWDRFLSWDDLAATSYEMECITRYEE